MKRISWKYAGETAVVNNPSEAMRARWRQNLAAAVHEAIVQHCEEVAVALRRLKPGEKVTITAAPMVTTITADPEPVSAEAK